MKFIYKKDVVILTKKEFCFKLLVLVVVFCFSFSVLSSQNRGINHQNNFWENVQFGGGIGLNFNDGFFSGSIAPAGIYNFSPYVSAGVGLNAIYSSERDVFNSTVLGGSFVGLFNPYRELQISTEFEQLYVNQNFNEQFVSNADRKYWYPALFLGLGYRAGNAVFGIRYDVIYNEDRSIQPEAWMPFVRFWF